MLGSALSPLHTLGPLNMAANLQGTGEEDEAAQSIFQEPLSQLASLTGFLLHPHSRVRKGEDRP